jgi:hypothetical protein
MPTSLSVVKTKWNHGREPLGLQDYLKMVGGRMCVKSLLAASGSVFFATTMLPRVWLHTCVLDLQALSKMEKVKGSSRALGLCRSTALGQPQDGFPRAPGALLIYGLFLFSS